MSKRQRSCAEMLAAGFTYKEIAETLGIARDTAQSHVKALFDKLGINNRYSVWAIFTNEELNQIRTMVKDRPNRSQEGKNANN